MKKTSRFLLTAMLVGALSACGPAPAAPTATAAATKDPTATNTPNPTATVTSSPTILPKILTYHVTVNCSVDNTIQVELNYKGETASQIAFAFNRGGFYWNYDDQRETFLKDIDALNLNGESLQIIEQKDIENNDEFLISMGDSKEVTIRYNISVGFWDKNSSIYTGGTKLGGYTGIEYCVIEPELLFLTPQTIDRVDSIQVFFSLPEDWNVVTFWENKKDYYISSSDALRMSKGPFGFGKFTTIEKMIGDTRVVVAAANGVSQPDLQLSKAIDLYEYDQSEIFGVRDEYSGNDSPRDGYIVIFIPATGSFYNLYHEEYGFYMSLLNQGWDNYFHMLSHNWTMDQERAGAPWYVTEGFIEYLQNKVTFQKGYITEARYKEHIRYKYNIYLNLLETNNDLSFIQAPTNSDIQYHKGALFALLLDDSLQSVTDGKIDLEDLMQLLYEKASTNRLDTREIELLTSQISDYDFSVFFDDYVYGTKKLPFILDSTGNVIVDHNAFSLGK